MVIGQHQSKIAENGRIALPKKFRDELGGQFVIAQGYEGALIVVPFAKWKTMVDDLTKRPFFMGQTRDTSRFLLGSASSIEVDEQGRFVIPEYLRVYAEIKDVGIFLGLGSYIELWDREKWDNYSQNLNNNSETIAQRLVEETKKSE